MSAARESHTACSVPIFFPAAFCVAVHVAVMVRTGYCADEFGFRMVQALFGGETGHLLHFFCLGVLYLVLLVLGPMLPSRGVWLSWLVLLAGIAAGCLTIFFLCSNFWCLYQMDLPVSVLTGGPFLTVCMVLRPVAVLICIGLTCAVLHYKGAEKNEIIKN